jgi:two-component system, OmpR family, sensor histidine kinase BaeS
MSLRWRIALGFALVALATAAVIALATPPIITQGFSDFDRDSDSDVTAANQVATPTGDNESDDQTNRPSTPITSPVTAATQQSALAGRSAEPGEPAPVPPSNNGQAQQTTILRLTLTAILAALAASLFGLFGASRLVRPLTRLEQAAAAVAHGDLGRRSGLADRSDEFGQLGRTFDSMAGELQASEENRRRFLQDAAHELKTPLAVIEATSSAILDGVYTPERRHIETIRDQSRVLARIVDDLRTISLAEGGHLPLERSPLDIRAVLNSVAAGFEARAASNSIGISVEAPEGLVVDADPDRLRQAIGALVDNALRHTPEDGSVRVVAVGPTPGTAVTGRAGASKPVVRLAVEDTGPGIPADSLPRIFERFYQTDSSRSRGTGTSGLGLSIVRALAEAHGGRAGAENRAEGGARIWIELPVIRAARQDATQEQRHRP